MKTRLTILLTICGGLLNACGSEEPLKRFESQEGTAAAFETLGVLSEADYANLTGCPTGNYAHALEQALKYLVFASDEHEVEEWEYRRRHIRPFLKSISDDGGIVRSRCLPHSVRLIGGSMGLLTAQQIKDSPQGKFIYDARAADFPDEIGLTLEVMSRKAYMEATECLLSPSSWEKYEAAVVTYIDGRVLGIDRIEASVQALFDELNASQPPSSGPVADHCLTPGLQHLAQAAGLLE